MENLESSFAYWERPLTVLSKSPVWFCFRLEEPTNDDASLDNALPASPAEGDSAWRVSYLLHPHDERSLLLPYEISGQAPKRVLRYLNIWVRMPGEHVLSALGLASGISP